ncbi:MarR family transcriptional regulator [Paenibacillus sp. PK3_47]|uniref:MarR family winged helix-turn-helix transcriptional regulator n=1 Tax=Paenibacillus sp. PK3_47 TaxID=2072642 RepID=UPI00201D395B|nr:helix-turn-helix domain-containing protein [Paenibacillus sp. PK3_47]UQZ36116.1 MarR family transcriptional regulator [Paenibacillus sp. PK3_47]
MGRRTLKAQTEILSEKWKSIDKIYEEYAKKSGLTYMSLIVLEIIYETPKECTQKLISELSYFPKQSVNMIIKSFLEQGYVKLKEIPSDRRNKQIELSTSGKEYADKIIGSLWEIEEKSILLLSYEERELFINMLSTYEESFRTDMTKLINDIE